MIPALAAAVVRAACSALLPGFLALAQAGVPPSAQPLLTTGRTLALTACEAAQTALKVRARLTAATPSTDRGGAKALAGRASKATSRRADLPAAAGRSTSDPVAQTAASPEPPAENPSATAGEDEAARSGSEDARRDGAKRARTERRGARQETQAQEAEPSNEGASREMVEGEEEEREEKAAPLVRSSTPEVSFGGSEVIVPEGEYHKGDLVCFGGRVIVRGEVSGSVVVIGGVATVSGCVRGDMVAIASRSTLETGAQVGGDLVNLFGTVDRAPGVLISGDFVSFEFPYIGRFVSGRGALKFLALTMFWFALLSTAVRFLAVLVVAAVAPARIDGALAPPQPSWILAFVLGFAVLLFGNVLIVILCMLCVSIPIAIVLWVGLRVSAWMGIASVCRQVGRNLGRTVFGADLSYFGSIMLGFVVLAIPGLIPLFGGIFRGLVSSLGLGLMLLTRYGSPARGLPSPAAAASAAAPATTPAPAGTPPGSVRPQEPGAPLP